MVPDALPALVQSGWWGNAASGHDWPGSARAFPPRQDDREIARKLRVSRNTVRKVLRSGETSFEYDREVQPRPKLGRWMADLDELLAANAVKPAREQLTLIRVFEELRGHGYEDGYDAVRRYARRWAKERGQSTATAYVPLSDQCPVTHFKDESYPLYLSLDESQGEREDGRVDLVVVFGVWKADELANVVVQPGRILREASKATQS